MFAALLLTFLSPLIIQSVNAAGAEVVCAALTTALGLKVSGPIGVSYALSLSGYYGQQEQLLTPDCIVTPTSTQDVVTAMKILGPAYLNGGSKFAIRSGGHGVNVGQANIDDGVTIDLSSLNSVTVGANNLLTSIGPGARWRDVYIKLDPLGLAVPGGRDSRVGVGGLTPGGGISYYSPRKGFVCDNVANFQVVLANGSLVNANPVQNSDLWKALRGGGNNFGIVTRVDLATFGATKLWGGQLFHPISAAPATLKAFGEFDRATGYDEYSSLIVSFAYAGAAVGLGTFAIVNNPVYTRPIANPPVYANITSITPKLLDTTRITNLTDLTIEQSSLAAGNARDIFLTTTFTNDPEFLTYVYQLWNSSIAPVSLVTGLEWPMSLQSIPPAITSKSASRGGNSLGLQDNSKALVLFLLSPSWRLPTDDALVNATAYGLLDAIDAEARRRGLANGFKYMNYAGDRQDVIGGYGAANKAELRRVSARYDPRGVFQGGVPGGIKLFA